MMEIYAAQSSECFDIENFEEQESDLRRQGEAVQERFNRIVLEKDFSNVLCANHEIQGWAKVRSKINEEYGEREYKGEIEGKYKYESNDKNTEFTAEGNVDTKGNVELETGIKHKF